MPGLATVVAAVSLIAAGCSGGATHTAAPRRTSPSATSGPSSTAASPPSVPNPFTVIARYSRSSLGFKEPVARAYAPVSSTDLAIAPSGNLYLSDYQSQSVTEVSPNGKVLRRWGGHGSRPGQFSFLYDSSLNNYYAFVAVGPDGKVYVDDSGNSRVEVFSSTGTFIHQFGSHGFGNGQFLEIDQIAVDAHGDVYVADLLQNTVSKFSPTYKFLWQVGGPAASDPDLRGVGAARSVDSHGRLLVTGPGEVIAYLDPQGHKVDAFRTLGDFPKPDVGRCDITVDDEGDTFALSCPGPNGQDLKPPYRFELVYDRTHHLVGAWYDSPFATSPQFGPNGEVFALGDDGSILKLRVALPGA